ncbi:MAG: hypothetical protein R3E12_10740 [Candidatus Eisenbacteria bacterium]|uniref:Outer membrane protein beta-barrel domain-containing protein n=1 Tax=Eiseniibacteriota bacterium TaxID=2212470 RepID=A0A956M1S4_UNCEI|nr:hypothetical protein [Candidatus Eisenbacteria bacterium]
MIALLAAVIVLGSASGEPALLPGVPSGAGSASGSAFGSGAGLAPDGESPGPDGKRALEPLVPEVAGHTFALEPGPRRYGHRLAFTPAFGQLGGRDLYAARLAYNPSSWLGYEIAIGHNPGSSVHALTHTLSALVRYPVPFRIQPYLTAGYGMVLVFPGQSVNADPVTENVLAAGGGLEAFVRDDVALRVEGKRLFVPGDDPAGGTAVYEYGEITVGLSFYRSISN